MPALLEAARNPKILRVRPATSTARSTSCPSRWRTSWIDRTGRAAPDGQPALQPRPGDGQGHGARDRRGLSRNDPEHADTYKKNLEAYLAKLDAAIARWEKEAAPLKGMKLVSYHPDLVYFADRFGMESVGTIELKPGVDPTPRHVEELEDQMRKQGVRIVVRERHYPAGLAETIAQQTGAKLVELPVMVGGVPEAKDYVSFVDYNVKAMLKAVQGG